MRPAVTCRTPEAFSAGAPGEEARRSGASALASLVLPGAGQWIQGQERAWSYLGVEVLAVLGYLERTGSGAELRNRYRDLAWRVARDRVQPRIDGDFDYYEAVADFPASGARDRAPDVGGIQPETDPTTYNGRIWELAREIYSVDGSSTDSEAYRRALEYYRERSYGPELAWSWTGADGARAEYRDLIEESDSRFREATIALGIVLGNHILSAVDAYVSELLGAEERSHLSIRPWRTPAGETGLGIRLNLYR